MRSLIDVAWFVVLLVSCSVARAGDHEDDCGGDPTCALGNASIARTMHCVSTVVPKSVAASIKSLAGNGKGRGAEAAKLLGSLGVDATDLASIPGRDVVRAEFLTANLDGDSNLESLALIGIDVTSPETPKTVIRTFLVAIKTFEGQIYCTVGYRTFEYSSCVVSGSLAVRLMPIHSRQFSDIVVDTVTDDMPMCNGNLAAVYTTSVITLDVGSTITHGQMMTEILAFSDASVTDRVTGRVIDGEDLVDFRGPPPMTARVLDPQKHVKRTLVFDPRSLSYKVRAATKPAAFRPVAPRISTTKKSGRK